VSADGMVVESGRRGLREERRRRGSGVLSGRDCVLLLCLISLSLGGVVPHGAVAALFLD